VIVAQQVQQAVQGENPQFGRGGMAGPARLPGGQTGRNCQIAKDLPGLRPSGTGRWKG
jgi:hypothetical protein